MNVPVSVQPDFGNEAPNQKRITKRLPCLINPAGAFTYRGQKPVRTTRATHNVHAGYSSCWRAISMASARLPTPSF